MTHYIDALLTGRVVNFGRNGEPSAVGKSPVTKRLSIGPLGLDGDEQADLDHHGGVDKAIHHYPHDHYSFWHEELAEHVLLDAAGAFGENISTTGLTEEEVCIGDRFRLGTALVEISQGRQPCWKMGHRFGVKSMPAKMVTTGKCGWYYRVIEAGDACVGDTLEFIERPCPDWPVALVFRLLIAGEAKGRPSLIAALAELGPLADNWRERAWRLRDK